MRLRPRGQLGLQLLDQRVHRHARRPNTCAKIDLPFFAVGPLDSDKALPRPLPADLEHSGVEDELDARSNELLIRVFGNRAVVVILPNQILDSYSSYHLYPIRIRKSLSGNTQKIIYEYLTNTGIIVNLHYIPIYLQPYYKAKGFQRGYCKEAELYFTETISLPIYPDLDINNQNFIIDTLKKIHTI